jgi:Mn2+/Fe2+ NRAMP family transporter
MRHPRPSSFIGPGLLVAATGVGAGDLATAGFAGSRLGPSVLWAVALGAMLKFVLNEGLARWQLATGQTLLEGAGSRFGAVARLVFAAYLLPWSFFVGAALISACGVAAQAMVPIFDDPARGKIVLGALHSLAGVALVWFGGFRLFERIMAGCIALLFLCVPLTALLLPFDPVAVVRGLLVPAIPQAQDEGVAWTVALMGGVGGTVTVLCYGYWIREHGRLDMTELRRCRVDLAVAYGATALFGMAMVCIASGMEVSGSGAGLIVDLADRLEGPLGAPGRWIFLVGAWCAVFSSLLGVWQAVPYLAADLWSMHQDDRAGPAGTGPTVVDTRGIPYRAYLLALAIIPLMQVVRPFREVQKLYAIVGAAFIPMLAITLLLLNGRFGGLERAHRNRPPTVAVLGLALVLALLAGVFEVRRRWG